MRLTNLVAGGAVGLGLMTTAFIACGLFGQGSPASFSAGAGAVATTDKNEICGKVDGLSYARRHRKLLLEDEIKDDFARAGYHWGDERQWHMMRRNYELDHIVPICAGGADIPANRRPQLWPEARVKDGVEIEVCHAICAGHLTPEQGQLIFFKGEWRSFIGVTF